MQQINHSVSDSLCKYLFGKEAEEIFYNLKFSDLKEKRIFIEECLALTIRIHIFILHHKDGFFLIDPVTLNNQCHLYALRVAQIKKLYKQQTHHQHLARTEENRFLHLSFFITASSRNNSKYLFEVYQKAIKELGLTPPTPKKKFTAFLMDEQKCREKASRMVSTRLFEENIKNTCAKKKEDSALYSELFQLAHENLFMESSGGHKKELVYTFPKFAGVAYMVDIFAKEKIAFAIKVKVITNQGSAGTIIECGSDVLEKDPVVIFEAIASDGSYTVPYIMEEAKRCPTYFYRYNEVNRRHQENECCFYCKKTSIDLEPFRQRLHHVMKKDDMMFYALGADFILQVQRAFKVYFENEEKYPFLSKIFKEVVPRIEELGLGMNNPRTFSICHVHTDSATHALSENLVLDSSPEDYLKKRGLI